LYHFDRRSFAHRTRERSAAGDSSTAAGATYIGPVHRVLSPASSATSHGSVACSQTRLSWSRSKLSATPSPVAARSAYHERRSSKSCRVSVISAWISCQRLRPPDARIIADQARMRTDLQPVRGAKTGARIGHRQQPSAALSPCQPDIAPLAAASCRRLRRSKGRRSAPRCPRHGPVRLPCSEPPPV
jgi:hypothetical protein